jgi:hypothetical protein
MCLCGLLGCRSSTVELAKRLSNNSLPWEDETGYCKTIFFFIFALLNVDRIDMDALTFIHQPSFSFLLFRAIERKL